MKVLSPAKINLMLRVLGQRKDGYHLLQTYFQLLDWGDDMEFTTTTSKSIEVNGNFNNLSLKENLIYQAAKLLRPYCHKQTGINIQVHKRIPQGSGLGGGSSNAGTTLRVLNKLWKCQLNSNELQKLAVKLGADVAVFVVNQSSMASGIGEQLVSYEVEKQYYVLIFPETSISTAKVFSDPSLVRNQKSIPIDEINKQHNWTNTCLLPVLNKYPQVKKVYNEAIKHTKIYLSGTGSTLFACFKTKAQALDFINLNPKHWQTQLCYSK